MLMGIDIGTSGIKAALVHPETGLIRDHLASQEILTPRPGWAEQDPNVWMEKVGESVRAVLKGGERVNAVSFSGQMHGIVLLGEDGVPLRNAIIWADSRSEDEINKAMETVGADYFHTRTRNRLAAGFGLASLLWIKKHEPTVLEKTRSVLCVKDYIRYKLCGELAQDCSDASGTCCMDVDQGVWVADIIEKLGLPIDIFPRLGKSMDLAGHVGVEGASISGLPIGTPLYFGGADQGVASIGAGIVSPGTYGSNIGTGGQVTTCVQTPITDHDYRTSTFIHSIPECWTMYGAVLAAGLSLKWLKATFFPSTAFQELDALAAKAKPGCDGLLFLPYLAGERTPYFDPNARGVFWGMTLKHGAPEIIRSVMEGVGFAMRQCFAIMVEAGASPQRIIALGGGAKSPLWAQIQADMYGMPVEAVSGGDACNGAAILAGVGCGTYSNVKEGFEALGGRAGTVYQPDNHVHTFYLERSGMFGSLYFANKDLFARQA